MKRSKALLRLLADDDRHQQGAGQPDQQESQGELGTQRAHCVELILLGMKR